MEMPTESSHSDTSHVNPEATLLKKLLRYYDSNAKPLPASGGPIRVSIGFFLGRIFNLVRLLKLTLQICT